MTKRILVDTDVMIHFLRGYSKAKKFIKDNFGKIILSSITVAELYSGVREGEERQNLDEFIELLQVIPVTGDIAKIGGIFRRDYRKTHGVGLADALIAATSTIEKAGLRTFNLKHFPMLNDVKLPYRR